MTDPKENEEINEELSTDDLKSVSGGFTQDNHPVYCFSNRIQIDTTPIFIPPGTGSGMTVQDWKRANKRNAIGSDLSDQVMMDRNLGAT